MDIKKKIKSLFKTASFSLTISHPPIKMFLTQFSYYF